MTTKADTSVKWFNSEMADAPVLSGQIGKLIELLDACLINGFSPRTPDSIFVSGGVATVSIGSGNPYEKHAVITIGGASVSALNAEWRIATSSSSSFTFLCPGVPDGAATGASTKRAGGGWVKPFAGTSKAVYQSQAPSSTQLFLRVDDGNPQFAAVRGYEQMFDIDSGAGPFPTTEQYSASVFRWRKSNISSPVARPWRVFTNGKFVWVLLSHTGEKGATAHMFGDVHSIWPGDSYCCVIAAFTTADPLHNGTAHPATQSTAGRVFARNRSQTGAASPGTAWWGNGSISWVAWYTSVIGAPEGRIYIGTDVWLADGSLVADTPRGRIPGVRCAIASDTVSDLVVHDTPGGAYMAVQMAVGLNAQTSFGAAFIDIMGPWE